ncbi:hypothetical protein OTU49_008244 [Cherax quadricarinatus]|uniref:Protein kinase domain-containing protein n=1 Tax=Cherax quadricarinatus TaxID=27406 RepID=A0AAW0WV51_CHEQU
MEMMRVKVSTGQGVKRFYSRSSDGKQDLGQGVKRSRSQSSDGKQDLGEGVKRSRSQSSDGKQDLGQGVKRSRSQSSDGKQDLGQGVKRSRSQSSDGKQDLGPKVKVAKLDNSNLSDEGTITVTSSNRNSTENRDSSSSSSSSSDIDEIFVSNDALLGLPSELTADVPVVSWDSITITEDLGEGYYGKTQKGLLEAEDGTTIPIAVKTYHNGAFEGNEAQMLHEADGAGGAPKLYGIIEGNPQALVMEYIPGITLQKFLQNSTYEEGLKVYNATAAALANFHNSGFAHLDLHCNNILVDNKNTAQPQCRLIDLGWARRISKNFDLGLSQTLEDKSDLHEINLLVQKLK